MPLARVTVIWPIYASLRQADEAKRSSRFFNMLLQLVMTGSVENLIKLA
jgi:hypothetical protein